MACDVFISHSVKDKSVADAVVTRLETESVRCWVAPRDVVPGADWGESIINAIESSRIMILIFSKSANESPQIKREVERAVNKEVYIIPFRVDDIAPAKKLEYFISTSQWMDAFTPPLERHLDKLTKTVKAVLGAPPPLEPTPGPTVPVVNGRTARPSSRSRIGILVAIPALLIVGAAGWYLGHKKQSDVTTRQPQHDAAKDPLALLGEYDARAGQARQEADKKQRGNQDEERAEEDKSKAWFAAGKAPAPVDSPTAPQPDVEQGGPWLFPDSSTRYLSPAELSRLSPADLWRARNEIFARNGYKFSTAKGVAFARTLGNYYRGVDYDQDRVFNNMNRFEQTNVNLIKSMEGAQ